MTAATRTTSKSGSRFYTWRQNNLWSATTLISGGVPKPALLPWGIKSVAEGVVKQRAIFLEMLKACETPDACAQGNFCGPCDQTIRWAKSLPYSLRDRAADLGTLVHEWIEADRLGKPMPKVPTQVEPYLASFRQFVADFNPAYEATEATVINLTERYAGTLDAIVTLTLPLHEQPARYVLDAKSGKNVYAETALQLAFYRWAEFIGAPDGSEQPMPQTDGGLALHLSPQGYRLIEVQCDETVFRAALYAREVYRWVNETSKSVLGTEYGSAAQAKLEEVA